MGLLRRKQEPTTVIDLREKAAPPPRWGSPVPCPTCGGRGYLDHIDPYREVMSLHCLECEARYDVTRADLERGSRSTSV